MANESSVCTICDERHIYRQSADWCFECEQALCSECKEFHAISKSSKTHATIPITDYQILASSIPSASSYCSDHTEKYQMFCQTHDNLLCPQCIEKHSKCEEIVPLNKITKNVKTSEAFSEINQCLIDIDVNILKIENKIQDKIRNLNDQKDIILSEISNVRQKINEHLDQIEAVIRNDVLDIEHKARTKMETSLHVLKEQKEKHLSSKQLVENVMKHASDLQAFLTLRQISSVITTTETFLQSIIDNGHLNKIELEFSVNENFRSIPDKIKTFGYVLLEKGQCDMDLSQVKKQETQAQSVVRSISIQDIKLKQTHKSITTAFVTGCDILPNGKLVFCQYGCLNVPKTDDTHWFTVAVVAFDVICISDETVAVTTGGEIPYAINIVDVSSRKILKFIFKDSACYGITSVNESLVYCTSHGIEMMDINGKNTTTIVRCSLPPRSYITTYNNKLYYNNSSANTVTCCDMRGNIIWKFNDRIVLRNPYDISVDNDGHVFVVCKKCAVIVVLSADGQQSKQIVSTEYGLCNPILIHYDRHRKQLLVTNSSNWTTTSFLFEVLF